MTIPDLPLNVLNYGSIAAVPLVLLAGLTAGLNPCCIAIYPAAAAIYCGAGTKDACCETSATMKGQSWKNAIAFVFGIAAANTLVGIGAALTGRIVGQLGPAIRYAAALVPLVMGLHLIGWMRLPIDTIPRRVIQTGWLGSLGAGFLLSLALTPCGTPLLASVLAYVAYKGSVLRGAILLFLYGIGAAIPLVVVGTTADRFKMNLEKSGYRLWTGRITGGATITLGLFLLWKA